MFRRLSTFLVLAAAINSASAAFDFTPTVTEYSAEGFTHRQLTFKSDDCGVTFTPPQGWIIRSGQDRLRLSPPDRNFVEATIRATFLATPQRFDEPVVKAFASQIITEAPAASQSVELIGRKENPVVMGQNLSFELVISYQMLGQTFQRSVILVNCPGTQLIFQFTAPKADFEVFHSEFRRSISSWQWQTPKLDAALQAANATGGARKLTHD